jgi:hypothetical protein
MSDQANRNPQQGSEQKSDHDQKHGGQPTQPGQSGQFKQPGQGNQSKNPQSQHETDDQGKRQQG